MAHVNEWLERAACWRFGALLFGEPDAARAQELTMIAPLLPADRREDGLALAANHQDRSERYLAVLGPGGCPAAESAYDGAAMANRGPLIAEVSAFYQAFEYPPRLASDLTPNHVFVELDFLGFLAMKVAFAKYDGQADAEAVAVAAYLEFRDRHPRFWLESLRDRLEQTGDTLYFPAAAWVCDALASESEAAPDA